jgi:hypothetical protein
MRIAETTNAAASEQDVRMTVFLKIVSVRWPAFALGFVPFGLA